MMKNFLKVLLLGLLVFPFYHCKRKKTPDLQAWLEHRYQGRFQVISTTTDDAIRNLSFKVKKSVVAEVANPMIQAVFRWDLRAVDLGLTTAEVDGAFANAATEWQDATALYEALKKHGFENMAVSIRKGAATVLVFAEPRPEARHEQLLMLEKALTDWPAASSYDKTLAFIEASELGKEFQEIVPLSYWQPSNIHYRKHLVFSAFCRYDRPFSAKELEQEWTFNTEGDRFLAFLEKAEQAITTWATEHYKKPYHLLNVTESDLGGQGSTSLKFKFPFTDRPTDNPDAEVAPDGYFVVDFDIDKQAAGAIKISKE